MKRLVITLVAAIGAFLWIPVHPVRAQQKKAAPAPPIKPKPEELRQIQGKVDELDLLVRGLQAKRLDEKLMADVEVYLKSGRFLLEFSDTFFTQEGITQSLTVLDQGIARAKLLQKGEHPWVEAKGRKIYGYHSALDGSVQPYGVTVPESYDGTKPARLYVWLHGRDQVLSEARFIARFPAPNKGLTYAAADVGQIIVDCYGRWNNANHWAGEVDVFEAIEQVKARYKIDPDRVVLRGFSLGGAGAWHVALHHPSDFAAAEIGAGTWPRRSSMPGFPPYQQATLRIWENIIDWSLNAFNLPLAAHDGDSDSGASGLPAIPGEVNRGQLESSLRSRAQLEREGFKSEGDPNYLRVTGTPAIYLISAKTGHSISLLVRTQVDEFLKEHGDKGRGSPDHIRFLSYTTRYNKSHWVSFEGLGRHYERAEIDAVRDAARKQYTITTKNLTRFVLREMNSAAGLKIDGQTLALKPAAEIAFEKQGAAWKVAKGKPAGLLKTHALQGPIDDAFLDPFLLVRPTGTPWNKAAHEQSLRILARFDRVYARWYRAHPRVKDDKDVTAEDFKKYNVALFGDPGSNRWIGKMNAGGKLPVRWTRDAIKAGEQSFAAASHLPALVYPNPLNPGKYVVFNSGLTIDEKEYQMDYSMPKLGDYAILKVVDGVDQPEPALAGLFDETWKITASGK